MAVMIITAGLEGMHLLDKDSFAEKAIGLRQMQYRVAWAILRCEADCQDALQEALLKAWSARDKLRDDAMFATWLTRILINECRTIRRKRSRQVLVADFQEGAAENQTDFDTRRAVDALPEKLRLPLVLHYIEGYPIRDVSKILSVPEGAIKNRLFRARKILKLELTSQKEAQ